MANQTPPILTHKPTFTYMLMKNAFFQSITSLDITQTINQNLFIILVSTTVVSFKLQFPLLFKSATCEQPAVTTVFL